MNWSGEVSLMQIIHRFQILETDYRSKGDQFSQELQLLYNTDKLNSVVGFFYFKEKYNDLLDAYYDTPCNRELR